MSLPVAVAVAVALARGPQAVGQAITPAVDVRTRGHCMDRKWVVPRHHENRPASTSGAGLMGRLARYCTFTCVQPPKSAEYTYTAVGLVARGMAPKS